jgi:hypothetical protein
MVTLFQVAPGDHGGWGAKPACQRGYDTLSSWTFQPQTALTMRLRAKPMRGEEKQ